MQFLESLDRTDRPGDAVEPKGAAPTVAAASRQRYLSGHPCRVRQTSACFFGRLMTAFRLDADGADRETQLARDIGFRRA